MSDADAVMVRPVRTFLEGRDLVSPGDEPYPVSRSRAVELRGNGLVEWVEPEEGAPAAEPAPPNAGTNPVEAPKPRGRRAS